jgi:hypothetical protein
MFFQLDLEEMCKKPQKKERNHLMFMTFGIKNFAVKNTQEIKALMFERYNLMNSME